MTVSITFTGIIQSVSVSKDGVVAHQLVLIFMLVQECRELGPITIIT